MSEPCSPHLPRSAHSALGLANAVAGLIDERFDDELDAFGTPTLVYSESRLLANYESIENALQQHWKDHRVYFAMKCCYVPAVLTALVGAGCGIEVMSEIELSMALQSGAAGDSICVNGQARSARFVAEVSMAGPALVAVDNENDLLALASERTDLPIAIRIGLPGSSWYAGADSKVGAEGAEVDRLVLLALDLGLNLKGLHCHALGRCNSVSTYLEYVDAVVLVLKRLYSEHGVSFATVNLGGGWESRLMMESNGFCIADFIDPACRKLRSVPYDFQLAVEPGRYIAGDAAQCLSSVMLRRDRLNGLTDLILDVSSNVLIPRPNMEYPVAADDPIQRAGRKSSCRVGDRTCVPGFIWQGEAAVALVREGSVMRILNCGAYTTVFAELWAFELPTIVWKPLEGESTAAMSRGAQSALWRAAYGYSIDIAGSSAATVGGESGEVS